MAETQTAGLDDELVALLEDVHMDSIDDESITVVVPDVQAQAQYPKITN